MSRNPVQSLSILELGTQGLRQFLVVLGQEPGDEHRFCGNVQESCSDMQLTSKLARRFVSVCWSSVVNAHRDERMGGGGSVRTGKARTRASPDKYI